MAPEIKEGWCTVLTKIVSSILHVNIHKAKKENDLKRPENCSEGWKDTGRRTQVIWTPALGVFRHCFPKCFYCYPYSKLHRGKKQKSNQAVPDQHGTALILKHKSSETVDEHATWGEGGGAGYAL